MRKILRGGWFLAATFFLISVFLGKELLKKFTFLQRFEEGAGYTNTLVYMWPGNKPGKMRNIVLRGNAAFKVLVSFRLEIPILAYTGTDWYGITEAEKDQNGHYFAVISSYMARKPVEFRLIIKSKIENDVYLDDNPELWDNLTSHTVYPPHFYQKLGFYA